MTDCSASSVPRNLMWVEVGERFTHMAAGSTHTAQALDDTLRIERDLLVAKAAAEEGRTIVLVEGLSDKAAIDALAKRHGWNSGSTYAMRILKMN